MSDCPGCDCRDAEIVCLRAEIARVVSGGGGWMGPPRVWEVGLKVLVKTTV